MINLPDDLPEMLSYDEETGVLTWKHLPPRMFRADQYYRAWNTQFSGKEAFTTVHSAGYRHSQIRGKNYLAHRVAWALKTGKWPDGEIDHVNGDRADNRWANLREVSHGENSKNTGISRQNKSGVVGVFWNEANKKWRAYIHADGVTERLGEFVRKADAIKARKAAERRLGFHPNHGSVRKAAA